MPPLHRLSLALFILSLSLLVYCITIMSPASSMSSAQFFAALKMRRSVYNIKASSPISDAAIRELVETAINLAPTAYNSQLSRVALVFGEKNKRMWEAMWEANKKTFPSRELDGDRLERSWMVGQTCVSPCRAPTRTPLPAPPTTPGMPRIWLRAHTLLTPAELEAQVQNKWKHAYMSSYGSLVFFDDTKALKEICEKMPKSADVLPIWTTNGQGILQVTMWTALATEGLGANLQHFPQVTPGADEAMRTVLDDIPEFWRVSVCEGCVRPMGECGELGPRGGRGGGGWPRRAVRRARRDMASWMLDYTAHNAGYASPCLCTVRSHQCSAVMPFGEIVEHPAEKNKLPMAERLKVYLD